MGRALPAAFAATAAGGVVGAGGRWGVGALFDTEPGSWPWATVVVNLLGSLLIGFAARRVVHGSIRWEFLVTGVLGGFTTMSALAVDANELVDAGRAALAVTYLLVTVTGGVGAVALSTRSPGTTP